VCSSDLETKVSGDQGIRNELICMYTNADSFINNKHGYETIVNTLNPDIIGITEKILKMHLGQ